MDSLPRTPTRSKKRSNDIVHSPYFKSPKPESPPFPSLERNSDHSEGPSGHFSPHATWPHLFQRLGYLKPCLIQEELVDDPWKLMVAVTLLNKTAGHLAIPIFRDLMKIWPAPFEMSRANEDDLVEHLRILGTQSVRAKRLILLSKTYLESPPSTYDLRSRKSVGGRFTRAYTPISHLPGAGPYALDSYLIFCASHASPSEEAWKSVMPSDKELIRYLKWKWAFVEEKEWSPGVGIVGYVDQYYLKRLITELSLNNL